MSNPWVPALVFMLFSVTVGFGMLLLARVLQVRARDNPPSKTMTYECGEIAQGSAWIRFHPRYYLVALVFVLFDVELVFLFPWALNVREFGHAGIVQMFVFIGVLLVGWGYALRKGALRWQ